MTMDWIVPNADYLDYLRKFEHRIPYSDYGLNSYKPFLGVLFSIDDNIAYISQVSHPKQRHITLKQSVDFFKVYDPKNPTRLLAVINLNYMFPIPLSEIDVLQYKDIENHRTFKTMEDKSKYIYLMRQELKFINSFNLDKNAIEIYDEKIRFPESNLSNRCFDFKELEKYAKLYKSKVTVTLPV